MPNVLVKFHCCSLDNCGYFGGQKTLPLLHVGHSIFKSNVSSLIWIYSQTFLKRLLKGPKKCGFLTQVNYRENCAFVGLKGWSLNTGGFKDRFDYLDSWIQMYRFIVLKYISLADYKWCPWYQFSLRLYFIIAAQIVQVAQPIWMISAGQLGQSGQLYVKKYILIFCLIAKRRIQINFHICSPVNIDFNTVAVFHCKHRKRIWSYRTPNILAETRCQ